MRNILRIYQAFQKNRENKIIFDKHEQSLMINLKRGNDVQFKKIMKIVESHDARSYTINRIFSKAIVYANPEMIKALLPYGPDINYQDKNGVTALMKIAYAKEISSMRQAIKQCVEILLDAGADTNILDNKGHNALFYAAQSNNPQMTKILYQKGCKALSYDKKGLSVIDYAIANNSTHFINITIGHAKPEELTYIKDKIENSSEKIKEACTEVLQRYYKNPRKVSL